LRATDVSPDPADIPDGVKVELTTTSHLVEVVRRQLERARSGHGSRLVLDIEPSPREPVLALMVTDRGTAQAGAPSPAGDALDAALDRARRRGATRAAEVMAQSDMLSADDFAEAIGATRETVHAKRRRHEVLGLEGPKRGMRFPRWQLTAEGHLLPALPDLFEAIGPFPWAVYRFLLTRHPALGDVEAQEALKQGRATEVVSLAESIGAGSFT
jgi:hypothetical protein